MANYNKVMLMGNLTRDPQLSYLPSQTAVVDFGLAINRRYTGKDGQMKEETCFIDCRAFGKPAETLNKYMSKGRPLFVEGRLTYDTWTGQDGAKKSRHRVTVENFQFLGAGGGNAQGGGGGNAQGRGGAAPEGGEGAAEDFGPAPTDDDIPF